MATETTQSETAINKSVDEKVEGLNVEKNLDEADKSKPVDTSPISDSKDKEIMKNKDTPDVKENGTPKEQTLGSEGLNIEKTPDKADMPKAVDNSLISGSKEKETLKEEEIPGDEEIEAPKEKKTLEAAIIETSEKQETPKVEESKIPKETNTLKVTQTETPKEQDSLKAKEIDSLKELESKKSTTESLKEEGIPGVTEGSSAKKQENVNTTEKTQKEEEIPEVAEKGNENVTKVVEEDKLRKEASESVEADREKEVKVEEAKEVQIPTVDKGESRSEDVPTTVVPEEKDGAKPSPRRSSDIFRKVMQVIQKMKNSITKKSSNEKASKQAN